ncbi:MAG: hypothetical protein J5803_02235 [Desulfovibrio sp.]|nr:hypothetical protein [Desulfovibrio sp.]
MERKTVVIGFLGTTLDFHGGYGQNRWNAWRPTVALGMQEDLLVHQDQTEEIISRFFIKKQMLQGNSPHRATCQHHCALPSPRALHRDAIDALSTLSAMYR